MYIPGLTELVKWLWREEPPVLGYAYSGPQSYELSEKQMNVAIQCLGSLEDQGVQYVRSARFYRVGEWIMAAVPDPADPYNSEVEYRLFKQ